MWDNHQALDLISNVLIVAAVLTSGYFISQWAVNLPIFPFKQVNVSSGGGSDGMDAKLVRNLGDGFSGDFVDLLFSSGVHNFQRAES